MKIGHFRQKIHSLPFSERLNGLHLNHLNQMREAWKTAQIFALRGGDQALAEPLQWRHSVVELYEYDEADAPIGIEKA